MLSVKIRCDVSRVLPKEEESDDVLSDEKRAENDESQDNVWV